MRAHHVNTKPAAARATIAQPASPSICHNTNRVGTRLEYKPKSRTPPAAARTRYRASRPAPGRSTVRLLHLAAATQEMNQANQTDRIAMCGEKRAAILFNVPCRSSGTTRSHQPQAFSDRAFVAQCGQSPATRD